MTLMTTAVCSTPALLMPLLFFYNTHHLLTYNIVCLFPTLVSKNNSLVLGCAGSPLLGRLLSSCRVWASHCRALGLQELLHVGSVVEAPGLWSTDSVVVVHRLNCSKACGIFPDEGSNLCLLHWQANSLPLSHQGSPVFFFFFFFYLWWILSYIEMKQARVYMCSPSQSPLPPPSPPIPSRFSQCTRSERLSHASNLGWWSVSP